MTRTEQEVDAIVRGLKRNTVMTRTEQEADGAKQTTTPELIGRLRDTANKGVSVWGDLQIDAANELEILAAERGAYASAMDRMKVTLEAQAKQILELTEGVKHTKNKYLEILHRMSKDQAQQLAALKDAQAQLTALKDAQAKQLDDLAHAKAVVRSFGYSTVTSKFIECFSEFISDWKKGDFDLPTLAALDLESCFVAWQEVFHEMEEGDPVAKIESLKVDAARTVDDAASNLTTGENEMKTIELTKQEAGAIAVFLSAHYALFETEASHYLTETEIETLIEKL